MKTTKMILFAIMAISFTGCVSGPISLPQSKMEPFPAASDRTPVRTSKSFQIMSVSDERSMGPHQLGWSGRSEDDRQQVVVERSVAETLTDRLREELGLRGFQYGVPGDIGMDMHIHRFEVTSVRNGAFIGPECNADVTIDISRSGKKSLTKFKVNSSFTAPAPLFNMQTANAQTVASCVNLIAERLAKSDELKAILAE